MIKTEGFEKTNGVYKYCVNLKDVLSKVDDLQKICKSFRLKENRFRGLLSMNFGRKVGLGDDSLDVKSIKNVFVF